MARKRRKHSLEFKQEAVRLVLNEGMSYAAVGSDLDVNRTTIRVWCLKSEAGKLSGQPATPDQERPLEEQVHRLQREVRILREEREILKKAAAFFAKESR